MRLLCALIVAWLMAIAAPLEGQDPGIYRFKVFAADQGLDTSTITSFVFDQEGRPWVGSEDGLFRWRGNTFERMSGLVSNYILALVAPKEGGVWVMTNRETRFWDGTRFQRPSERGVKDVDHCLAFPSTRPQVLASHGNGVGFLTPTGLRIATGQPGSMDITLSEEQQITTWCFGLDRRDVYLTTADRLLRWKDGHVERKSGAWDLRQESPVVLLVAPGGRLWIRTTRTLHWVDGMEGSWERLPKGRVLPMANNFPDLMADGDGRVWTSTAIGLFSYYKGYDFMLDQHSGIPHPGGNYRFGFDREGSLWLGTEALLLQQGRFLWSYHTQVQGLPSSLVWRTWRDPTGRLWAATQSGAAYLGAGKWVADPASKGRGMYCITGTPDGGAYFGGVTTDPQQTVIWRLRPGASLLVPEIIHGVRGSSVILDIVPDGEDEIWLATSERYVMKARRTQGRWQVMPLPWGEGSLTGTAYRLLKGRDGALWIAGFRGIQRWDGQRLTTFGPDLGLPEMPGLVLAEAPDGRIWAAYLAARHVAVLENQGGTWRPVQHFKEDHPLARDAVFAMAFDADGTLMLGTARGVKRWDGKSLETYDTAWGLPGKDCSQHALMRDRNGDWWVGTSSGLAHYHADRVHPAPPLATLTLIEAKDAAGQQVVIGGKGPSSVPAHQATLRLRFEAKGHLGAVGMHPQVRILGLDQEWRDLEGFSMLLPHLSYGDYRLEMRMHGWDGRSGSLSAWSFTVLRPWYHRWWARALGGLMCLGLVFAIHRLRVRHLHRVQERLEAMVRERTLALAQINDELIQTLAEVKTLRGLVPICSYCKKVRRDDGFWHQLERVLAEHTEATFSHGICPECAARIRTEWRGREQGARQQSQEGDENHDADPQAG